LIAACQQFIGQRIYKPIIGRRMADENFADGTSPLPSVNARLQPIQRIHEPDFYRTNCDGPRA
jgi:hypothetical protein